MPQQINILRRGPHFDPVRAAMQDTARQGQSPTLQEAIVVEVFTEIDIDPEFSKFIKGQVTNPYFVDIAPPNAIVAKIISNSAGTAQTNLVVLFPMFSSHMQFPVYPGEKVSCIFGNGGISATSGLGFWFDTTRGAKPADDLNYTHADRVLDPTNFIENYTTDDLNSIGDRLQFGKLRFNNGAEHSGTYTLNQTNPNKNPYNILIQNSYSAKFLSIEPIPRYNKRPNEFVLQGKNNSLIVLGEDRRGSLRGAFEADQQNKTDNRGGSASIDIVVGRGRTKKTAPNIALNERDTLEANKVSFKYNKTQNPNEGDPDFVHDAARILVTQNSKADENFGLLEQKLPNDCFPIRQPSIIEGRQLDIDNFDQQVKSSPSNNSYVVAKADQVRVISRNSNTEGTKADGSILLIHEGSLEEQEELKVGGNETVEEQSKGLSYLMLNTEGAHIQGKFIHLGPSRNHEEPMILWSNYVQVINGLQNQITELHRAYGEQILGLQSSLLMLCQTMGTVFSSANVCPPGSPNPAIAAASGILLSMASQITSKNPVGGIAELSTNLMQKQRDVLDIAKAENQSKIIFNS